jgi:hypothetical protein
MEGNKMVNVVGNVLAGKPLATGGVLVGPIGTTVPATVAATPDVALVAAGYIGEDGVTQTIDRSTEKVRAWGGDIIKVLQTEVSVTYQFTFAETLNTTVMETVYGESNVTVTPAAVSAGTLRDVKINSKELPHAVFVFEIKDGDAKVRVVVPNGQITAVGDITFSDASIIQYQVTVEAFADASGNQAYIYSTDGVFDEA